MIELLLSHETCWILTKRLLNQHGIAYEGNIRYKSIGGEPINLGSDIVFYNRAANLLDLQKVYHTLQFENPQALYDFKVLQKELNALFCTIKNKTTIYINQADDGWIVVK